MSRTPDIDETKPSDMQRRSLGSTAVVTLGFFNSVAPVVAAVASYQAAAVTMSCDHATFGCYSQWLGTW